MEQPKPTGFTAWVPCLDLNPSQTASGRRALSTASRAVMMTVVRLSEDWFSMLRAIFTGRPFWEAPVSASTVTTVARFSNCRLGRAEGGLRAYCTIFSPHQMAHLQLEIWLSTP